jgi:hypothetical protein
MFLGGGLGRRIPSKMKNIPIIRAYGKMWARNQANINAIPSEVGCHQGVYVLFDGSLPVYVGKGKIRQRIRSHQKRSWNQLWDRFSWYVLEKPGMMHEIESLMLKMLPPALRSLNKQAGNFLHVKPTEQPDDVAIAISRKRIKKSKH